MKSFKPSAPVNALKTHFGDNFVSIDYRPPELQVRVDIETMASLHSPPVYSRKRVARCPPLLSFAKTSSDCPTRSGAFDPRPRR